MNHPSPFNTSTPGLLVRLVALAYDSLLLFAVLMLATFPYVIAIGGPPESLVAKLVLRTWLVLVAIGFFGWFWTHGGQTLGMRAWRLKLVREDGGPVTWSDALKRLAAAVLSLGTAGLGYAWILVDKNSCSWHDRLSHTRVLRLAKIKK
ncbi:MAG: RDD family protein [Gammaproteobacteria bacterium]|nr:RDD family protein [Gammaproteobacteria bacterium]